MNSVYVTVDRRYTSRSVYTIRAGPFNQDQRYRKLYFKVNSLLSTPDESVNVKRLNNGITYIRNFNVIGSIHWCCSALLNAVGESYSLT